MDIGQGALLALNRRYKGGARREKAWRGAYPRCVCVCRAWDRVGCLRRSMGWAAHRAVEIVGIWVAAGRLRGPPWIRYAIIWVRSSCGG
jgi:hypothetical protein